jgi:hypothetical protein
MVISGQLVLAAGAQRLSNLYGGASLNNAVNAAQDIAMLQVVLFAEGADAFLGQDALTTSTNYGNKVDSAENLPVYLGPFTAGALKLSDLWAAGAGSTIHVLAIGF